MLTPREDLMELWTPLPVKPRRPLMTLLMPSTGPRMLLRKFRRKRLQQKRPLQRRPLQRRPQQRRPALEIINPIKC